MFSVYINNIYIDMSTVITQDSPSILLNLDDEIWSLILEFVTNLYYNSLHRTSKKFKGLVIAKSQESRFKNGRKVLSHCKCYLTEEINPRLEYVQWALDNDACVSSYGLSRVGRDGLADIATLFFKKGIGFNDYEQHLLCVPAAKNGDLEFLKSFHTHKGKILLIVEIRAIEEGHLHIIKWINENLGTTLGIFDIISIASQAGKIPICEWAMELWKDRADHEYVFLIKNALDYEQIDFVKWFLKQYPSVERCNYVIQWCIQNENFDIFDWIMQLIEETEHQNKSHSLLASKFLKNLVLEMDI